MKSLSISLHFCSAISATTVRARVRSVRSLVTLLCIALLSCKCAAAAAGRSCVTCPPLCAIGRFSRSPPKRRSRTGQNRTEHNRPARIRAAEGQARSRGPRSIDANRRVCRSVRPQPSTNCCIARSRPCATVPPLPAAAATTTTTATKGKDFADARFARTALILSAHRCARDLRVEIFLSLCVSIRLCRCAYT